MRSGRATLAFRAFACDNSPLWSAATCRRFKSADMPAPPSLIRVIRAIRGLSPVRFQRFNDLTAAKQFVFIRVYSWLTFADGCG